MRVPPRFRHETKFDRVQGFFTWPRLYTDMVINYSDNSVFVEVGVYEGRSLYYLLDIIRKQRRNIKVLQMQVNRLLLLVVAVRPPPPHSNSSSSSNNKNETDARRNEPTTGARELGHGSTNRRWQHWVVVVVVVVWHHLVGSMTKTWMMICLYP